MAKHKRLPGRQQKQEGRVPRPHIVGVRLSDEELRRLQAQRAADGRDLSEILRDWFNHAPDPKPLRYVRRMSQMELLNYHRLLDLIQEVWKLREQARELLLPAERQLLTDVLSQLHRLADSLVPAAGEPLDDVFTADWVPETELAHAGEDGLFIADPRHPRQRSEEPFPDDAR